MPEQTYQHLQIGITVRQGHADAVQKTTKNYLNILAEYGVRGIILAPDVPTTLPDGTTFTPDAIGRLPAAVLAHLDGIIFSGGGDVDPKYFGATLNGAEPESIDHPRDELEIHLGQAALARDMPIFGICRGCQVLNVAAGGQMVQHFTGHRSTPEGTAYHDVQFSPDSRLGAIVGQTILPVNTFHHQGMDRNTLAPIFTAAAVAQPDDWIVEAYESLQHRWVVGVQWHPERIFELESGHRRIWESFLAACDAQYRLRTA